MEKGYIKKIIMLAMAFNFFSLVAVVDRDQDSKKQIIISISPPRNCSTVFLRMMQARGDCDVLNEQFLKYSNGFNRNNIKENILKKAEEKNVFLKELSYSIKDFILKDVDLIQRDNVRFIFLMRNPHHALISLYKKLPHYVVSASARFSNQVGYKSLYEIFMHIKQHAKNSPAILLAEDLYTAPTVFSDLLCSFLKIPHENTVLEWADLGTNFCAKEWNNDRSNSDVQNWHGNAIHSTNFHLPTQYKIDASGQPTFEEIPEQDREICKVAYAENLKYYKLLLAEEKFIIKHIKM